MIRTAVKAARYESEFTIMIKLNRLTILIMQRINDNNDMVNFSAATQY